MKGNIRENLNRVLDNIREAELRSGRKEGSVQLVAVSKFHPVSAVVEAYEAGQRIFGENRVQEAVEKFSEIGKKDIELHLIGSLQRNKVGKILPYVSCIQSVDRIELVMEIERKLSSNSDDQGKTFQNVLMEIHTGEESKSGYTSEKDLFDSIDYALKSGKVKNFLPNPFLSQSFTIGKRHIFSIPVIRSNSPLLPNVADINILCLASAKALKDIVGAIQGRIRIFLFAI